MEKKTSRHNDVKSILGERISLAKSAGGVASDRRRERGSRKLRMEVEYNESMLDQCGGGVGEGREADQDNACAEVKSGNIEGEQERDQ